jgi:hypothetical protein
LNDEILNLHFAFAFFLPLSPLPFLDVGVHGRCWKKGCVFSVERGGQFYSLREGDTVEWQVQRSLVAHACICWRCTIPILLPEFKYRSLSFFSLSFTNR